MTTLGAQRRVFLQAFEASSAELDFAETQLHGFGSLIVPGGGEPDVAEIDTAGLSVIAAEFVILAIRLQVDVAVRCELLVLLYFQFTPEAIAVKHVDITAAAQNRRAQVVAAASAGQRGERQDRHDLIPLGFQLTRGYTYVIQQRQANGWPLGGGNFKPQRVLELCGPIPHKQLAVDAGRTLCFKRNLIGQGLEWFDARLIEEHQSLVFRMGRANDLNNQLVGFAAGAVAQPPEALHD
nr:hypothetical protein [Pseudomonas sp. A-RE-19]